MVRQFPSPRPTSATCGSTRAGDIHGSGRNVEHLFGKDDGLRYLNGYKPKIVNERPIVGTPDRNDYPPGDQ
jgi:hypothetical protein